MTADRRAWLKPELVVLVRSRPQEDVLSACKHPSQGVIAPGNDKCKQTGVSCELFSKT